MNAPIQAAALAAIVSERRRQDAKWGVQFHTLQEWMGILVEEVGELAKETNESYFGDKLFRPNLRAEAIQVAAVAVAIIEALDEGRILLPGA